MLPSDEHSDRPAAFRRVRGLPVLFGLILIGMGVPAYLMWMVPRLETRRDAILAAAPSEPEGRLARWFEYGQPRIYEALIASRFSAQQPWLVTHAVLPTGAEQLPQVFGIDFRDLEPSAIRLDGLAVRIVLPAPTSMGRQQLGGDSALGVPKYAPGVEVPDPRWLAKARLELVLKRVIEGLTGDIPGARISVEIGGLVDPEPVEGAGG